MINNMGNLYNQMMKNIRLFLVFILLISGLHLHGQSRQVEITLKAESLGYWDVSQNRWVVEEKPVR